jgi:hypothetical protein
VADTITWDQLPGPVRAAIEEHTGPVTETSPAGDGMSTTVRLILHAPAGDVFVKGTGPDSTPHQRRRLALGAQMAPHVTPIGPPLLFQASTGEWDITGWPALPGRPAADQAPGTADIPQMTRLLNELSALPAPGTLTTTARAEWGRWAEDPAHLDGGALVHSDPNPTNFVINGEQAWLVDWGWALRGPAWLTAALLILSLRETGWEPADAEQALNDVTAWSAAPPSTVTAFAETNARMWDRAVQRAATPPRTFRHRIARQWAAHRAGHP